MRRVMIAQFDDADALLGAARGVRSGRERVLDAFTPFPVQGLAELLGTTSTRLRVAMAAGGFSVAALFLALQAYSAIIDYPVNSGGRPLNSWPAFMLVPFATGILAAAVCGFAALMMETGLPRLHHPLFELEAIAQASQERFVLALEASGDAADFAAARQRLSEAGAVAITEVEP